MWFIVIILFAMAKQTGFVRLTGKLGELSFYESEGVGMVRRVGDIDGKKFLRNPEFRRMRENMSEFGASSMVAKRLRMGLHAVKGLFGGRSTSGRLNGVMRLIVDKGSGECGKRSLDIAANRDLLKGFEFNDRHCFDAFFGADVTIGCNAARTEVVFSIPGFYVADCISAPDGATHFKLVCAIAVLSDYVFDEECGKYRPIDVVANGKNAAVGSNAIAMDGASLDDIRVSCGLHDVVVLPSCCSLVCCVGIEFLKRVDGNVRTMKGESALVIGEVFSSTNFTN